MLPLSPFAIFTAGQALALVALPAQQYTLNVNKNKGRYFDVQVCQPRKLQVAAFSHLYLFSGSQRRTRKYCREHPPELCMVCSHLAELFRAGR